MDKKIVMTVKKEDMKAYFNCPICNNLCDRTTSITECLHAFCKKCIEDKFIVENRKSCPVCNLDLGVAPLAKLRRDTTWDDLKQMVFKKNPQTVKAATEAATYSPNTPHIPSTISPEPEPTSKKYFRKKKKDVSSRVTSPEPLEPEKLGDQLKAVSLNQSSSLPASNLEEAKRNETLLKPAEPSKQSGNGFKALLNIEQDNRLAGASTSKGCIQKENNPGKDNEVMIPISSGDLGKSLSTTDKAVMPLKSNDIALIDEIAITPNGKENQNTVLNRFEGETMEVPGEANQNPVLISSDSDTEEVSGEKQKNNGKEKQENVSTPRETIAGKKGKGKGKAASSSPVMRSRRQRSMSSAGTSSKPSIFKEAEKKVEGSIKKVWLSLIAATHQNTDRPLLPQISSRYLRTDGNAPASSVNKYLAKKLGLASEDEVEIWLRHEPVCPTHTLEELVDWWVHTTPIAERKSGMVGRSGADFTMVLHYTGSDKLFK